MKRIDADAIDMLLSAQGEDKAAFYGRRTISAGAVGHECDAFVAFSFRSFPEEPVSDQSARRFILGREIEKLVANDLKGTGLNFLEKDPKTGRQFRFEGFEGHVKCYADGIVCWDDAPREPVEIKSMADKRFRALLRKGLKAAEPKYFDQVQTVMALSKSQSLIFVAYNKDNSTYRALRVEFDEEHWEVLKLKIDRILEGEVYRIAKDKTAWPCSMCDRRSVCHDRVAPPPAERQCHHCHYAYPDVKGQWWCTAHGRFATGVCESFKLFEPKG